MLTQKIIDARILELSNTASDMMVGLDCLDTPEVEREARILKEQAHEHGLSPLAITAHKIEQAAASGDLDLARELIPELNLDLQRAEEYLGSQLVDTCPLNPPNRREMLDAV